MTSLRTHVVSALMGVFFSGALLLLFSCAVKYPAELMLCTETSSTLCESITCENAARAAKGRVLRPLPKECQPADAGTEGGDR